LRGPQSKIGVENRSIGFQKQEARRQKVITEIAFPPQSKKQKAKCQKQM